MDPELELKAERFRRLPRELRLQALLGYAKRFPELPNELRAARDRSERGDGLSTVAAGADHVQIE